MVGLSIDATATISALERLKQELSESAINRILIDAGSIIEKSAKRNHKHTARSHNLENSTFSSIDDGILTVALDPEDQLPYADYIHDEWGDPFLYEAGKRERLKVEEKINQFVKSATKKAGF